MRLLKNQNHVHLIKHFLKKFLIVSIDDVTRPFTLFYVPFSTLSLVFHSIQIGAQIEMLIETFKIAHLFLLKVYVPYGHLRKNSFQSILKTFLCALLCQWRVIIKSKAISIYCRFFIDFFFITHIGG